MYSMYMWNMLAINPAYAGSHDVLNAAAVSRMQWVGISGAPVTHALSGHAPVNKKSLAVGGNLVHDRIGRTYTTSAFGDITYRIRVNRKTRLAFGLSAGFNHLQLNNTEVEHTDPNDPTFATNLSGKLLPNFGFGMYLWSKRGYVGVSVPKLLQNRIGTTNSEGHLIGFQREAIHGFLTAGYVMPVGAIRLRPALMIRAVNGAPLSGDLVANVHFNDRFCVGAGYRYGQSIIAMTSIQVTDQFKFGYAYDMGLGNVIGRNYGSHELMISYDPVYNRERIRSPRYF